MLYFGFAMSSSMFADGASIGKRVLTSERAKMRIEKSAEEGALSVCLNPSHAATIAAMAEKFGIFVEIPETAPRCSLKGGDSLLVLQVAGLPRLDASRHEYTSEEVEGAKFTFDLWEVS